MYRNFEIPDDELATIPISRANSEISNRWQEQPTTAANAAQRDSFASSKSRPDTGSDNLRETRRERASDVHAAGIERAAATIRDLKALNRRRIYIGMKEVPRDGFGVREGIPGWVR